MKYEKNKSRDTEQYTLNVELQAGHRATFSYTSVELADAHYYAIQANPVIGNLAIKNVTRSWRK